MSKNFKVRDAHIFSLTSLHVLNKFIFNKERNALPTIIFIGANEIKKKEDTLKEHSLFRVGPIALNLLDRLLIAQSHN